MKKSQFENVKAHVVKRAKELHACTSEFKKLIETSSKQEIADLIRKNSEWCYTESFLTDEESLEYFGVPFSEMINIGVGNEGYENEGYYNKGNRNDGNDNKGNYNNGNDNNGNDNKGNYNKGNRNDGNNNIGNDFGFKRKT